MTIRKNRIRIRANSSATALAILVSALIAQPVLAAALGGSLAKWLSRGEEYADTQPSKEAVLGALDANAKLARQTAQDQRDQLWQQIQDTQYNPDALPTKEPDQLNSLHMLRDTQHLEGMFSYKNAPHS